MNLDKTGPVWTLLQHDLASNTMVVIRSWKEKPTKEELAKILDGEDTVNFHYYLALASKERPQ